MARKPAGIPLDDEPMDFDLGDLPTDEELDAAASSADGGAAPAEAVEGEVDPRETTLLALFQLWFVMVAFVYFMIGWGVGALFAFRGASQAGLSALASPGFYLIVVFWPVAVWQLLFKQF